MNDQRETKKITCPSGKEVEMKTYLSARERRAIKMVFLTGMKVDITKINQSDNGNVSITEITGDLFEKSREKLVEVAVVTFDGSSENVMDRILDGTPEDYDFIATEANAIGQGNLTEAK